MAKIPSINQSTYSLKLSSFGGVDFTSNETQVALSRSPDACNMISDETFFPIKRFGVQTIRQFEGKVNGIHVFQAGDAPKTLVHAGTSLYLHADEPVVLRTGMNDAPSASFVMGGCLYLLDGLKYLRYDGSQAVAVTDAAFVPTTTIGMTPSGAPMTDSFTGDGTKKAFQLDNVNVDDGSVSVTVEGSAETGVTVDHANGTVTFDTAPAAGNEIKITYKKTIPGTGTSFEAVNLLTNKRVNSFAGDGESDVCFLDASPVVEQSVTVTVNGSPQAGFDVDASAGVVRFASPLPDGGGIDNVLIRFEKAGESGAAAIDRCRFAGLFGGYNDTRVFVSGDPQAVNVDWQSGLYDPTYFPDTGYTRVGSDASAIMGYARQFDTQIIIKESGQDATQWLRTFLLDDGGRPVYPLMQGAVGAGAVTSQTFGVLSDEPLFLSSKGVCAVVGTNVAMQRTLQNRGNLIAKRLLELDAGEAVAFVHKNKYYLALGRDVFIADGGQVYFDAMQVAQYEWYYWSLPCAVTCFASIGGVLHFGTRDGRLCRMKDAIDAEPFTDDGEAFQAWWVTPLTTFGTLHRTKTIRDVAYMLKPYAHTDYKIYYRSDRRDWTLVKTSAGSLLDWNFIDFNDWSFVGITAPYVQRIRGKERKIEAFDVKLISENLNTGMGLLGIEIVYSEAGKVR